MTEPEHNQEKARLRRWVEDQSLPPYSYVPGKWPHPHSDPRGHSYGAVEPHDASDRAAHWREQRQYLRGIDLFNFGYYWEAHEAWEAAWKRAERHSVEHRLLQGLIKLAAAAVKAREGNAAGVARHARRAAELFRAAVHAQTPAAISATTPIPENMTIWGLSLAALSAFAENLATDSAAITRTMSHSEAVRFSLVLEPSD